MLPKSSAGQKGCVSCGPVFAPEKEARVRIQLALSLVGLLSTTCLAQTPITQPQGGEIMARIRKQLEEQSREGVRFPEVPAENVVAVPIDQDSGYSGRAPGLVYSAIPGPYSFLYNLTGTQFAVEDYVSTLGDAMGNLNEGTTAPVALRWVGGANADMAGRTAKFQFFDTAGNLVPGSTFTITFGAAGAFIYSISLAANSNIQLPSAGFFSVSPGDATTHIQWYISTTAPTIGSTVPLNTTPPSYATMELAAKCPTGNPVYSAQPPATLAACQGSPWSISVASSNATGYHWYQGTTFPLTDTGVTTATYIGTGAAADANTYRCAITGGGTCGTILSSPCAVTLNNCTTPTVLGNTVSGVAGTVVRVSASVFAPGGFTISNCHADFSSIGGSNNVQLFDDGTNGDLVAHDGVYSRNFLIPNNAAGPYTVPVTATDNEGSPQSGTGNATIHVTPANDECAGALPAVLGNNSFSNNFATDSPNPCNTMTKDLWYTFTPAATGELSVSTCTGTTADTVVAIYDGCGGATLVCDDDGCGADAGPSNAVTCVTAGHQYLIRVGGYNGTVWSGSFSVSLSSTTQPSFTVPDICVATGTPAVIQATISNAHCQSITAVTADASSIGGGSGISLLDNGAAPDATAGDHTYSAFTGIVSASAGDYTIPVTVTSSGAAPATVNAAVHVHVYTQPVGGNDEQDPLGCGINNTNGNNEGCNISPPTFSTAVMCGENTGTVNCTTASRDLDWWHFTVDAASTVTVTGQTEFANPLIRVVNDCPANTIYGQTTSACIDFTFTATLPAAGTYVLIIAPGAFDGAVQCGQNSRYHFRIEPASGCGLPPCCRTDFNGDGAVGTDADIEAFFACLSGNCCPTCPPNADYNCDGGVGTDADIDSFFRVLSGGAC
jgi:hypothetical protein